MNFNEAALKLHEEHHGKIEVVSKVPVEQVVDTCRKVLYTGHIGDGKIFIYDVQNVIKVRTGAVGYDALQYEE